MSHNLSPCNPPRARKLILSLMTLLVGQHKTVFSVACDSDSETLVALQTVETVVRTQRHRLDADKFPMLLVGLTWREFCRDLDPCWSE